MALVLKDRVKETTTTTGTGTYTLAGAVTGFEAFSSVGDGNTTYYSCTDGTDFEVGIGTYTSSGTTLARTTILQSSNSDSAVSWSSGTKTIFCAQPAEKAVFLNASDNIELADNEKVVLGTGGDLEIFHSGSTSAIIDSGTGDLKIGSDTNLLLTNAALSETKAKFVTNGAAELYHDNSKKLETTADGVSISGDTLGLTSTDAGASAAPSLQLYRNSASPADADDVGQIQFHGENDADEKIEYARIDVRIEDASDGEEDGQLDFEIMEAGSSTLYQRMAFGTNQFYKTLYLGANVDIQFEGDNFNDHETTLTVAEPTADRTITLPDATGTVLTTADSGIENGNVATFTSGVADNDFLRIDGTSVEGRSASEVLSDIGATTAADAANEATALAIALG